MARKHSYHAIKDKCLDACSHEMDAKRCYCFSDYTLQELYLASDSLHDRQKDAFDAYTNAEKEEIEMKKELKAFEENIKKKFSEIVHRNVRKLEIAERIRFCEAEIDRRNNTFMSSKETVNA